MSCYNQKMEKSLIEKKFLYVLLVIVILITLVIFYPFLTVLILAGAFAVVLYPICLWIKKHLTRGNQSVASIITIVLFLALMCVPLFIAGTVIFKQAQNAYYSVITNNDTGLFIQTIDTTINKFLPSGFTFNTHEKITQLLSLLSNNLAGIFTSTFNTIFMSILTIFTIFYLLKNGSEWKSALIKLTPLSENNIKEIFSNLTRSINRILKGTFFIAIIQGILSWAGFIIFGVPNAALWGVISALASFIPNIGTSIILIPAIIFLYITGMQIQALGLLLWSFSIVGMIDNILAPYLISKDSEISPIFIMFAILGGISLMGAIGVLVGPLVLSLLYSLVSIYKKETKIY